ncbi:MAG TPA: glycosyltransferase family 4 protein, partial [Candidatus Methylomirabilis sp.]|nr:glycosyltransferase family 4 protein [Candidatus Methylomirabilis sp.]
RPRSPLSIFICHFPDSLRRTYFAVDDYTFLITNSEYGKEWVGRRWGLGTSLVLHPAVDMQAPPREKEPIILSVSRFEPGGSKRQDELIRAFRRLLREHPEELEGWRLILAGGSLPDNDYLKALRELAAPEGDRISFLVNAAYEEIGDLYARASLFWHACGLNAVDPHWVEHFGMTTVEAMQNACVPIVINGGGQREIVEHERSGFLFTTVDELCHYTRQIIGGAELRRALQEGARLRSEQFRRARFDDTVKRLFGIIAGEYAGIRSPDPQEVLAILAQSA